MDTENKTPQPQAGAGEEPRRRSRHKNGRNRNGKDGAAQNHAAQNQNQNRNEAAPQTRKPQKGGEAGQKRRNDRRPNDRAKWGLVDPYGKPTADDALSLKELRAKIVVRAADGSAPATAPVKEPATVAVQAAQASVSVSEEALPSSDLSPMPADPEPATEQTERVEVVGVRFRSSGKVYYFDPKGLRVRAHDFVIVETVRGAEYGEVTFGNRMIPKTGAVTPLRPLIRVATPEDIAHNAENCEKEKEALRLCQERIVARGLDMKLIDAQFAFDNTKLLFYFSSEGRVDFRELVKDLAAAFHTRIELRQIGIRDEAKMLGGLGACGRPLCCSTFLNDFGQVSIKMAKEQNLSLNSLKISGICGRLMCCLRYEADTYAAEAKLTPPVHATVKTADGIGTVISSVPLAGTVKVQLKDAPDAEPKTYGRDEVVLLSKKGREPEEAPKNAPQPKKKAQQGKNAK